MATTVSFDDERGTSNKGLMEDNMDWERQQDGQQASEGCFISYSKYTKQFASEASAECLGLSSRDHAHAIVVHSNSSNNNSNVEHAHGESSTSYCHSTQPLSHSPGPSGSGIEVALDGKTLWEEFCRRGTEMIVNRSGRRMFPGFSVSVSGLRPKVKYNMKLEVVLADNHRFKFLNSKWLAVGSAEPQPSSELYVHPDSPNSGAFWIRHGVSFRKLKITNNKDKPASNALLYSMHKYFLRLVVEEECKASSTEGEQSSSVVARVSFPETTFIAVTAYQNEEVTQLKITNNPFAKAFRENGTDADWEAAQMFCYGHSRLPYDLHIDGRWPGAMSSPILMSSRASLLSGVMPPHPSGTLPPLFPGVVPSPSASSSGSVFPPPYPSQYNCPHHFHGPVPPPLTPSFPVSRSSPLAHHGHIPSYGHAPSYYGNISSYYSVDSMPEQSTSPGKDIHMTDF